MNNSDKSKSQLIEELGLARRKLVQLEAARTELEAVQATLRQSERRLRIALQNSDIVVYNQDQNLRYTWIHSPTQGFAVEAIIGKTDAELLPPEDAALLEEIKRRVLETGIGTRETVRATIKGEACYYDLTAEPLRDALGNIIGITGTSKDITEQVLRVAEQTAQLNRAHQRERVLNALLRLSMEDIPLDAQLERALDELLSIPWLPVQPQGAIFLVGDDASAGSGVLELRAQRGFDKASQAACKRVSFGQCLCGRAAADQALIYAQPGDERHEIHHEDSMAHGHYCVPILSEEEIIGTIALYLEQEHPRDAQQEEFLQAVARTLAGIIKRKRVEVAVLEERGRLARDLHDSVTQSLYSITLLAEGWKRLERAGRLDGSEDPLAELGEIAQQALKEMRLLVHELRPPDLDQVGLLGALHLRLGAVEKRAGVDARLVADDVVELSPRVEECLYRIAIEALNNALKHAGATSVVVGVRGDGEKVELEVSDNGCGFDVEKLAERRGMGLQSMRERAEQVGGVFLVDSTPSEGTRVIASVSARTSA